MEQLLITALSILFFPVIIMLVLVMILASIGKSMGMRRMYVRLLIAIFEFGKTTIDEYEESHHCNEDDKSSNQSNGVQVIERDILLSATRGISGPYSESLETLKREFQLSDVMYFAKCGMESIIEDEVTKVFSSAELSQWNFLTRTGRGHQLISLRLTMLWCLGGVVRYFILLPFSPDNGFQQSIDRKMFLCRDFPIVIFLLSFGICWLIICTAFIGYLPEKSYKRRLNQYVSLMCNRILARACSAIITYHNSENKAKNGICVANHTSPIDVIVLSCDNCYAMVGQAHGGLIGLIQRALSRATSHVWFERSEVKDRTAVAKRLKDHVDDELKLPMLIFPEGTCINNTSVMMFKKGSFEIGSTVYPVAIKYDPRFSDAFWNSSKQSMVRHIWDILTSWALVVDIWYLPPMTIKDDEDSVQFACRVKKKIASQGGLVDLEWDGGLKRTRVKESMKIKPQEDYSKIIKLD